MNRLQQTFQAIDAANSADPNQIEWLDHTQPAALVYGWRMTERLQQFAPDASEELQIAARAQHIERFKIPRDTYPKTKQGYHRWRRELADFHAQRIGEIMQQDYPQDLIERVQTLITRKLRPAQMKQDPECQTLEDVVCLVFIEHYLEEFAATQPEDKLPTIIQKTWAKMSPQGQQAALQLDVSTQVSRLLKQALSG